MELFLNRKLSSHRDHFALTEEQFKNQIMRHVVASVFMEKTKETKRLWSVLDLEKDQHHYEVIITKGDSVEEVFGPYSMLTGAIETFNSL